MARRKEVINSHNSIIRNLGCGTAVSLVITLIATFLFSGMISKEMLSEETMGYCALVITFFASLVGTKAGIANQDEKKLYIALLIGMIYIVSLLSTTGLFFAWRYKGDWLLMTSPLLGCLIPVMPRKNRAKNSKVRRSKKHCC